MVAPWGTDTQSALAGLSTDFRNEMGNFQKQMVVYANAKILEQYQKLMSDLLEQIERQNKAIEQQTEMAALGAGFIRSGNAYIKQSKLVSSAVGMVEAYRWYDGKAAFDGFLSSIGDGYGGALLRDKNGEMVEKSRNDIMSDLPAFLEDADTVQVESFFSVQKLILQAAFEKIMGTGTVSERKNSKDKKIIGELAWWIGKPAGSSELVSQVEQAAPHLGAEEQKKLGMDGSISAIDGFKYLADPGFGELGSGGNRPSSIYLGFYNKLDLVSRYVDGKDSDRMERIAGSIDPISATMNQFNPVSMIATAMQNVRVASEVYGTNEGYMWEAQLLSAAKGALPAIGFAIGGPGGAAVGAALASTIHVDAKTGKRSYQTTDETLVQAAVAAGLSQMGPGLTQSLVSASAAGMEYDANGKVTGKFNAGNAAIAFAGDYVGSKFNATHMSQYLARDITTQVLTVGTEYYNYSHGYENNYAAISNPDLSRLGALAGGLYMAGSRDSDEAKAQEIKNKGLAEGKTPKEIAAMMAAAGLEDIAKQIELGLQGKANEADQTQRMADIMRGLGIKTREDPFGNVALELGKFALGAVSFPIGIAGLLAMGTFGVAGETLGLLGKGAYSLGHGVGGTLGMIANTVGSVVGGVAGIGAGLLGGLAFGASLPIVLLASAMYGFGEAGVNLLSGDVDGAGRSLDNILGRVEAYGAAGSDFIKELIGGSIDLMGSMPDRNRMISEWMAAGFMEPWTHAQANKEAESQYIEYLLQHHGGTDAENHFAQRLLRDEGFDYVDGQGVWTAQKKMEDGRIMRIELTPDGKMNQIIQEGSPLGFGWLGLDSTYINGKRMENGDAFYRDVNMNLSVMQGGRKAIAAEMRKLGAHNYIGTQNGVWNTGLDAVGLNNFVRTQVAPGMDDYGGSFGVYNSSSFFGDVGHLALSLMLQSVGLSGTESAGETWKGIFDSGVFKDGGVIVAHSQGAQIVTHALQSWHGENTTLNTLEKTDLITLGGAHTIKPLDVVRSMYDMRNSPDKVTMFFHSQGDLVNRPNDQKYQRIFGPSSSPNDPANHTAVSSYDWALPTYLQRKRSLGELK